MTSALRARLSLRNGNGRSLGAFGRANATALRMRMRMRMRLRMSATGRRWMGRMQQRLPVRAARLGGRALAHDEVSALAGRALPPPFATPVDLPDDPRTATPPLDHATLQAAQSTLRYNWRGTYTAPSTRRPSGRDKPLDPADGFRAGDQGKDAKYPWQWLWDSGFHATVLSDLGQDEHAVTELSRVLSLAHRDGFIPNFDGKLLGMRSGITQSPVLGETALRLYQQGGRLPGGTYERLSAYHDWLHERASTTDGMYAVRTGLEAGNDTSPVFDRAHWGNKNGGPFARAKYMASRLVRDVYGVFAPRSMPRPSMGVRSVLFNSIYARDLEAMRDLAHATGRPADAARYQARYQALRAAMRARMRDPKSGHLFWSLDKRGEPIRVATNEMFLPLYAGVLEPDEARALVDHLTDPKHGFWTRYPIPSTATTEEAFDPNDYWRGPTWINCNHMVLQGLLRYGFYPEAKELYERTVSLFHQNHGPMAFNEGYHPETGEPVRQGQFGWSTLVVSMGQRLREYERDHGITARAPR